MVAWADVEEFLETKVEEGLKASAAITTALTDEANAIMSEVADIVSLPKLDDTLVHESIADAKDFPTDTWSTMASRSAIAAQQAPVSSVALTLHEQNQLTMML